MQADIAEIGQTMTMLDLDGEELNALLEESPQQVYDLAARKQLVRVEEIGFAADRQTSDVLPSFSVFRTDIDGSRNRCGELAPLEDAEGPPRHAARRPLRGPHLAEVAVLWGLGCRV